MDSRGAAKLALLAGCLAVWLAGAAQASLHTTFLLGTTFNADTSPTEARNMRASARYHWASANKAQTKMLEAENDDNVDDYEMWLEVMREEDRKWQEKEAKYNQLRDEIEAKIRTNEIEIQNFEPRYEKGAVASIIDHLTLRART